MRRSEILILAALAVPVIALAQTQPSLNHALAVMQKPPPPLAFQTLAPTRGERAAIAAAREKSARTLELINANHKRSGSPPVDTQAINRTQVPVLIVPAAPLYKAFQIFSTRDHYVLSGGDDLNGVVVTGTRVTQLLKGQAAIPPLDPKLQIILDQARAASGASDAITDVTISLTEDGAEASFRRFGALYDLRLACAKKDAPECSPEQTAKLIGGTVLLGGGL